MGEYELTGHNWLPWEVQAVVADYIAMLIFELRGLPYNKAEHNRDVRKIVVARSRGSVELKHQNISAVLIEMGLPCIDGYKPRFNYQELLAEVVRDQVLTTPELIGLVEKAVESAPPAVTIDDILSALVDPPAPPEVRPLRSVRERPQRLTAQPNYLLREILNSALGNAGEEFVLNFERARLAEAGKDSLADRVEQVSRTRGAGEGFDILSFERNGKDRYIEVKTTKFGAYTPFYVTANEFERSRLDAERYHVYRVFGFREQPRLYTVAGAFDGFFSLDASQYIAKVKPEDA